MPHFSRAQEMARQQIAAAGAAGLTPEALGSRLLAAIDVAVPNDDRRLWTVDPSSLLLNRLVAASAGDAPFRHRWLQSIYLDPDIKAPYYAPHELMRFGVTAVAYHDRQERTLGLPPFLRDRVAPDLHYREFHDSLTPAGGSTRLCLRAGGRWIGMLDVVCRDRGHPMAATDYTFLRLVGPTIARALNASLVREQAMAVQEWSTLSEASGILVLTAERRVSFATPAAETWLARLFDCQRAGPDPLPTAVWAAVAALRARSYSATSDGQSTTACTIVAPSAVGLVRVEASRAGDNGSIAVVLAPVRPPGPPPIPETWPLTAQERRIVALLLGGASNRHLAATLHVTENTVETHLGHIFEKLGVRSRTGLIGLLFQHEYLPGFEGQSQRLDR